MPPISLSKALAEYVLSIDAASIPTDVIEKARLCLLDTLGCMIAGAQTEQVRMLRRDAAAYGARGPVTLLGEGSPLQARDAVLANGTAAHVLEFDDGHRPSDNHLGCVVVPSAIAAAEEHDRSIDDLIASTVVGYDVMGRIGEAVCLPRMVSPFHGTATTGAFASAAVYGRLAGMAMEETHHALNIAGTAAAGLREAMAGGQCKPLQVGQASRAGFQAAQLASLGYEGPSTIFEGPNGFLNAMTTQPRPDAILADLGDRFAVVESGFKLHACCGVLFTAVDLAIRLRAGIENLASVDGVKVALPSWIVDDPVFSNDRPDSVDTGRFSVPFVTALALRDGRVDPSNLTSEAINDPELARVADRVHLGTSDEIEDIAGQTRDDPFFFYPASLTLKAGAEEDTALSTSPRGYDPSTPLSAEEVVEKFRHLAGPYLTSPQLESTIEVTLSASDVSAREVTAGMGQTR